MVGYKWNAPIVTVPFFSGEKSVCLLPWQRAGEARELRSRDSGNRRADDRFNRESSPMKETARGKTWPVDWPPVAEWDRRAIKRDGARFMRSRLVAPVMNPRAR